MSTGSQSVRPCLHVAASSELKRGLRSDTRTHGGTCCRCVLDDGRRSRPHSAVRTSSFYDLKLNPLTTASTRRAWRSSHSPATESTASGESDSSDEDGEKRGSRFADRGQSGLSPRHDSPPSPSSSRPLVRLSGPTTMSKSSDGDAGRRGCDRASAYEPCERASSFPKCSGTCKCHEERGPQARKLSMLRNAPA